MVNRFDALCSATQTWPDSAIPRAQLPILLFRVNGEVFARVLFAWFGLILSEEAKCWFTFDGKELRGSIQSGHQRGESCVSAQSHDSGQIVGQTYFNGTKESERPAVLRLLSDSGLCSQKITLDALTERAAPLTPKATKAIDGSKGVYLIGLKSNQAHLYRYCLCRCLTSKPAYKRIDEPQRGHGRIDQPSYACHSLPTDALAARWRQVGMGTCIAVTRTRNSLEGKPISQ